jgi:hypothetical protein
VQAQEILQGTTLLDAALAMRQVSIRLEQEAAIHLVLIHQAEAQAILRATIHQVKVL